MKYFICTYADYVDLPDVLYTGHSVGFERKSLDQTKFIIRTDGTPGVGALDWMTGSEPEYTHAQIKIEVAKDEWAAYPTLLKINLGGEGAEPTAPAGWNNISPWSASGDQSENFVLGVDGFPSVNITLTNTGLEATSWGFDNMNGNFAGGAGASTGDDSGVVPDDVLEEYFFIQNSTADIIISGLDDRKTYTVKTGGSRGAVVQSRITNYTIGAVTNSVECQNNTANEAVFTSVAPVNGGVTMTVENTNNEYAYCGWLEIAAE
jgi:hypothetical protein